VIVYPVTLTPDDNGTFLVTSPDFHELSSFGMQIPRQEVDRMLDLNHGTALPKMELAFAVLGRQLRVEVRPRNRARIR
jgi:hypothetical protein